VGWHQPAPDDPPSIKKNFLTMIHACKLLLRMPLIWINAILIIVELLFG
jgi:hypothetical protein